MNEPSGKVDNGPAAATHRNNGRNSLLVKASLRFPTTGEQGEVRVRNISAGGLMAEAPVRAGRGEPVEVNLKNVGWVSGKVAWIAESRFGIAFDYPIDPAATRVPIATKVDDADMPHYLRKLNQQQQKTLDTSKLRPL